MKRIIGVIITVLLVLTTSAVFCACSGDSDNVVTPPGQDYYTVEFHTNTYEGGYIEGKANQKVREGGCTEKVTAVANPGYYFVRWWDDVEHPIDESLSQAERIVYNVRENNYIVAEFAKLTVTVTYSAERNGYIDGVSEQSVKYGETCESVTAVPNYGYMFTEWSDGVKTATRKEVELCEDKSLTARFDFLTKTYTYNYKFADAACEEPDVALTFGKLDNARLSVPMREHAEFVGWYADRYLTNQVADKNGNVIADNSLLYSDGDTLYAKWIGENTEQYKILIVYVTELVANISKNDGSGTRYVHYKMTETEREICHMITEKIAFELNDLAIADFVVDEYFTTVPLDGNSIETRFDCNEILPINIEETRDKYFDYDSVLSSFSFNDYRNVLIRDAGFGSAKYGGVHFDCSFSQMLLDGEALEDLLDPLCKRWDSILSTYFHELAHTVELRVNGFFNYHKVASTYMWEIEDPYKDVKLYFLNKAVVNGEIVGIPYEFWERKVAEVYYEATPGGIVYKGLKILQEEVNREDDIQFVLYGQDAFSVEAIAKEGYEFEGWSDGVMTPIRQDTNIIADMHVYAIFTKQWIDEPEPDPDPEPLPKPEPKPVERFVFTLITNDDGTQSYAVSARVVFKTEMVTIVIPDTYNGLPVTEISNNGFMSCTNLKYVVLPISVKKIGDNAFMNCPELEHINLTHVESIGIKAFELCPHLDLDSCC